MPAATAPGGGGVQTGPANAWWMIKMANGSIGLVKGNPPANTIQQIYIGTANTFADLENNHAQALGNAQGQIGASSKQLLAFIDQIDHGAGLSNLSWLFVGPDTGGNSVSSNVSTQYGSEAQGTSLIPGTSGLVNSLSNLGSLPNILSGIWQFLTAGSTWVRILEYIGGAALIFLAIKELA
jgi:hypothetical protein